MFVFPARSKAHCSECGERLVFDWQFHWWRHYRSKMYSCEGKEIKPAESEWRY